MANTKTLKGYITQTYAAIRGTSKRRGEPPPKISKIELEKWLIDNGVKDKWIIYIESGFNKNMRPSIDRIDDYGVYEFSNMQLITWKENFLKGINGDKHHKNCKNQGWEKRIFIWSKTGELKKECKSHGEAAQYLGCHLVSVGRAANGKRKTLKNHILTHDNTGAYEELF